MPLTRLLTALLLSLGVSATTLPVGAVAGNPDYGRAWRPDGQLRPGCDKYGFQYRVRPAQANIDSGDDWSVEFFLVDRRRRGLGVAVKDSGADPKRGTGHYTICRQTTSHGRFRIRGKLSVYEDGDLVGEVWVEPARFRLR